MDFKLTADQDALVSAWRYLRQPGTADHGRLAGANGLIALGTLVLSSGGLVQGVVGHDEPAGLGFGGGAVIEASGFEDDGGLIGLRLVGR